LHITEERVAKKNSVGCGEEPNKNFIMVFLYASIMKGLHDLLGQVFVWLCRVSAAGTLYSFISTV